MQTLTSFITWLQTILAPLRDLILQIVPEAWIGSLPALTLIIFASLSLAVGLKANPLPVSIAGIILAWFELLMFDPVVYGSSFGGLFVRDAFADFFIYIILIIAFLVMLSSTLYGGNKGPYDFLLLISFAGAIWVVMATDLVALFLAWEMMSTPTYILVALGPDRGAIDGATKYFVMGLVSTMFMILGIALVFGVTGATALSEIALIVNTIWGSTTMETSAYTLLLAMVFFIIAFGFKIGIFPGWMWVPDTYSTADGSVTAYLSGATKKTGISALVRIFMVGFFVAQLEWSWLIVVVSVLTMIIGNLLALAEKDILRMLAYSSIATMGYLMIGIAVGTEYGLASAFFLAFIHALMKAGAFILVFAISIEIGKRVSYDELEGLQERSPLLAGAMGVFMFALAGIPPTAGFLPKFMVFMSAVEADLIWLAVIGALNAVFSLGYYLRVVRRMYFSEAKENGKLKIARAPLVAVMICVILMFVLFPFASFVLDFAYPAASAVIP